MCKDWFIKGVVIIFDMNWGFFSFFFEWDWYKKSIMLIGEFILKIIYGMCFNVYNYYIKKIEIKS